MGLPTRTHLPKRTGQQWDGEQEEESIVAFSSWELSPLSLSYELLPCRTDQDGGRPDGGLHCVLKMKLRLSDAQERPSVFDNHTPALLNQNLSSSHELHREY